MLLFNRTYNQYVKYRSGIRQADGLSNSVRLNKIKENFDAAGYYQSQPQGYQSAAVALIPTIKTSSFIAAILRGEGTYTGAVTAIGNLSATLQGEGTANANANMALNLNATLEGEGTFTPGLTALGQMSAEINAGAQPSAFDIAQETLGQVIDSGVNLKDVLKILLAVSAGKSTITDTGGTTATVKFRDAGDTTDVLTASMDGSERINITLDI